MSVFSVPDIHCEGCIKAITAAVRAVAPDARIVADLATKQVEIAAQASDATLAEAMRDAGFSPEPLAA